MSSAAAAAAGTSVADTYVDSPAPGSPNVRKVNEKLGTPDFWDANIFEFTETFTEKGPGGDDRITEVKTKGDDTTALVEPKVEPESESRKREKWEHLLVNEALAFKSQLEVIEKPSDCKCLFHCWAHHFNDFYGQADAMRCQACDYMDRNKDDFVPFFETEEEFSAYVKQMRNQFEFGDGHCNRALVDHFTQPLLVFRKATDQPPTCFLPKVYTRAQPMMVELDETRGKGAEHYNILERPVTHEAEHYNIAAENDMLKKPSRKEVSWGDVEILSTEPSTYLKADAKGGIPSRYSTHPKVCKKKYPPERAIAVAKELHENLLRDLDEEHTVAEKPPTDTPAEKPPTDTPAEKPPTEMPPAKKPPTETPATDVEMVDTPDKKRPAQTEWTPAKRLTSKTSKTEYENKSKVTSKGAPDTPEGTVVAEGAPDIEREKSSSGELTDLCAGLRRLTTFDLDDAVL